MILRRSISPNDALDFCIISWEGVQGAPSPLPRGALRAIRISPARGSSKLVIGEPIKTEIARICFGRAANGIWTGVDDDGTAPPEADPTDPTAVVAETLPPS